MFSAPLGLLALLAVPAVLVLHLLRRRFRPHPTSALFLWHDGQEVVQAGRRLERLRPTASLVCELAAALLLALALAGPRGCAGTSARHLVCVLDGSASMAAVDPRDEESAADRARDLVRERIEDLPSGSRVTLLVSGRRPRVLAGPAAFPPEALDALAGYAPREPGHPLASAAALALELAGESAVLVVSDRLHPGELPERVEQVALGRPLENAALTHAARVDAPGACKVFATAAAFGAEPLARELTLAAGGVLLARQELRLVPGSPETVRFDLPPAPGPLVLRLGADALELDDRADLAPAVPRPLRLAVELDDGTRTRLGLEPARLLAALPEVRAAGAAEPDLLVTDRAPPPAPEGEPGPALLVLHPGREAGERLDLAGPFLVEKAHPLLQGVALEGVVWSVDPDVVLSGTPLVSAGDLPLLTEEPPSPGRARVVHASLDPARSSLQRSPDWPVLLANLVELVRADLPGPARTNLTLGETFVHRSDRPLDYVLRGPDGDVVERLGASRRFQTDRFPAPGLYELEGDGAELCAVGVRFADPAESDLRGAGSGRAEGAEGVDELSPERTLLVTLLAAGVLVLVLLDWISLLRAPLVRPRPARRAA